MNRWVEERTEAIRLALEIDGFPEEADTYRMVDWLGPNVDLRHERVKVARCLNRPDGGSTIVLPKNLYGRPMDLATAHEIGHVLTRAGVGSLLRQVEAPTRGQLRLASLWDRKDEITAEYFVRAWFMPSALVALHRYSPDELAAQAHVTEALARQRIADTAGQVVVLTAPPAWSAHWEYHVVLIYAGVARPVLFVAERHRSQPAYQFDVTQDDAEDHGCQLTADLMALSTEEFQRKYASVSTETIRHVEIDFDALHRRAAQRAASRRQRRLV